MSQPFSRYPATGPAPWIQADEAEEQAFRDALEQQHIENAVDFHLSRIARDTRGAQA